MTESTPPLSTGERIAAYRRGQGLSQKALGELVGRTESWMSQVERGAIIVDRISVLKDLAGALRVRVTAIIGPDLYLSATEVKPRHPAVVPLRRCLMADSLILPRRVDSAIQPRPIKALQADMLTAWRMRQAARYVALGELLPRLIPEVERAAREWSSDDQRAACAVLSHVYQAAAGMLKKLGEYDLAWIAADRAVRAADHTGDPLLVAGSAYRLANVQVSAGRVEEAEDVALAAAATLAPTRTADGLAMWGGLLITAALAASRRGDRRAVRRLLGQAKTGADDLGTNVGNLHTIFGPTVVAMYEIKTMLELGDGKFAIDKAATVDGMPLPDFLIEHRAYQLIDLARCYGERPDDDAAIAALQRAEGLAPEEIQHNPVVMQLVWGMLRRERRSARPGLRPLARTAGVLV